MVLYAGWSDFSFLAHVRGGHMQIQSAQCTRHKDGLVVLEISYIDHGGRSRRRCKTYRLSPHTGVLEVDERLGELKVGGILLFPVRVDDMGAGLWRAREVLDTWRVLFVTCLTMVAFASTVGVLAYALIAPLRDIEVQVGVLALPLLPAVLAAGICVIPPLAGRKARYDPTGYFWPAVLMLNAVLMIFIIALVMGMGLVTYY